MQLKKRDKTTKRRGKLAELVYLKEGDVKSFDGTRIHYKAVGQGLPIVCCNGFGVNTFFWKYLENHFKQHYQVVTWDYRGHGHSGSPKDLQNATMDALLQDCKAVLNKLKIKKAIFVGFSLGSQIILDFYRRYPKSVKALIPCLGTYGKPIDTFYNTSLSKYLYQIVTLIGTAFPKQSNLLGRFLLQNPFWYELGGVLKMVNTGLANKEDVKKYVDHIVKVDPKFFAVLLQSVGEHTAENILKKIKVPTLIIGAEQDQFTPVWIAKKMHRTIPKSELFIIKNATHAALLEQPELINLRIEKFLRDRIA